MLHFLAGIFEFSNRNMQKMLKYVKYTEAQYWQLDHVNEL